MLMAYLQADNAHTELDRNLGSFVFGIILHLNSISFTSIDLAARPESGLWPAELG